MAVRGRWTILRGRVAERLRWLSLRIQPPIDDQDPSMWEVSVVRLAASADSRKEAIRAVYQVTKNLDEQTVHLVLLKLAQDVAWEPSLGSPDKVVAWADVRRFYQTLIGGGVDV